MIPTLQFDSVAIIESLPDSHLKTGTDLFEVTVSPVAEPTGFIAEIWHPDSTQSFLDILDQIAREAASRGGGCPIIHIETHGDREGVRLRGGELIPWADIAPRLAKINHISRMNLLVVAAMCHGRFMIDILDPTDRAPAFGIIGTYDEIRADHLYDAMTQFYGSLLVTPHDLNAALAAANPGAHREDWLYTMMGAERFLCMAFESYLESLETEESPEQRLNRMVAKAARAWDLDVTQTMQVREQFRAAFDDHARWFEYYRTRFLMLDEFPENEPRFPLRLDDCGASAA